VTHMVTHGDEKRIFLITGGAGFIGSHLAESLVRAGGRVLLIDDLSTGSRANLAALDGHPDYELVVGSVMDRSLISDAVARVDYVFHLAAAVGVKLIVESPVRTIETNVRGTESVLEAAALRQVPVLLTSTSEVYGKSTRLPFSEDHDLVLGPTHKGRWSYACSKALDEYLALAYWHEKRLPVVVVRLFNTVGPRQTGRYGMVLPTFVRQAMGGKPITVYGDGTQSRCFGYVGDIVWALRRLAVTPEAAGQVFNIGSQEEITIGNLANLVKSRVGSRSEVVFVPYDEAYEAGFEDMQRRVPDIRKIQGLVGFEPRTPLTSIIDRIAAHRSMLADPISKARDIPPSQNHDSGCR
jgi:UDP-glucose 4-epimerase